MSQAALLNLLASPHEYLVNHAISSVLVEVREKLIEKYHGDCNCLGYQP